MSDDVPRLNLIPKDRVFELGKKIDPDARSGWLKIDKPLTADTTKQLEAFLKKSAPRAVIEVAGTAPLSVLDRAKGVPFVILSKPKSFDGLESMPASVRRLSIRKLAKPVPLTALPPLPKLAELEIDAPSVEGDVALPALRTIGWTGATDAALPFIERQPALYELALKNAKITKLPAAPTLERLLLLKPSQLESLRGIEKMKRLAFLRIDQPKGMARLGRLSALRELRGIKLVGAHAIADLTDLADAPALSILDVSMTQLDASPFKPLKGKLKAGSFHLKQPKHAKELLAHLGVPHERLPYVETTFFDFE